MYLYGQDGRLLSVILDSASGGSFSYDVPPNGVFFAETRGFGGLRTGSAYIQPAPGQAAPVATAIFRYRVYGILVSEAGVGSSPVTRRALISVDLTNDRGTGIAVANPLRNASSVFQVKLLRLDGTATGLSKTMALPPSGQIAKFVSELFPGIPTPFQGALEITGNTGFAPVTLRVTTNQRGDALLTTLPVANPDAPASTEPVIIPHLVSSGEIRTQVLLINSTGRPSRGSIHLFAPDGRPLTLRLNDTSGNSFVYDLPPNGTASMETR